MMQTTAQEGIGQDAFDAFLAQRDLPDWLAAQRRDAWARFLELDWPSRREEQWMRTDIRLFKLDDFGLPGAEPLKTGPSGDAPPAALLTQGVELAGAIASVDSMPHHGQLDPRWAAKGVLFGSLDQMVLQHGDLIREYLFHAVSTDSDRFAALHAAAWSGGSFLYVPRGVVVDQPFHTLSSMTDGGVDMGHTLVVLEEDAEATFMMEMASSTADAKGLHCGAIELFVGKNARLRFVSLQDWGNKVWHFGHQKATLARDANLQWTMAAMGSRLAKVNQQVFLDGEGAESQVNGVLFTEGRQHLAYHTLQHHRAAHCRSDFLYKSALQDRSQTVWRGMIKVDKDAQKTDGYQRNDNLLLSSDARSDSIPGLEIEADDVRCTHGSTSGRVSEELIFYACCRGLSRQEAIQMIVTGFFQQIFDRVTIQSVREALAKAIARRVREYE